MTTWVNVDIDVHVATQTYCGEITIHLEVSSSGDVGWDWLVWDGVNGEARLQGLANTLGEAMWRAEAAATSIRRLVASGR